VSCAAGAGFASSSVQAGQLGHGTFVSTPQAKVSGWQHAAGVASAQHLTASDAAQMQVYAHAAPNGASINHSAHTSNPKRRISSMIPRMILQLQSTAEAVRL